MQVPARLTGDEESDGVPQDVNLTILRHHSFRLINQIIHPLLLVLRRRQKKGGVTIVMKKIIKK